MTNRPNGVLYIGVTSELVQRVWQHKMGMVKGFSKRYNLQHLVYFQETNDVRAALQHEKNMKHWVRDWKITAIEKMNPNWLDLSDGWCENSVSLLELGESNAASVGNEPYIQRSHPTIERSSGLDATHRPEDDNMGMQ